MTGSMTWCSKDTAPSTPIHMISVMQKTIDLNRLNTTQHIAKRFSEILLICWKSLLQLFRLKQSQRFYLSGNERRFYI